LQAAPGAPSHPKTRSDNFTTTTIPQSFKIGRQRKSSDKHQLKIKPVQAQITITNINMEHRKRRQPLDKEPEGINQPRWTGSMTPAAPDHHQQMSAILAEQSSTTTAHNHQHSIAKIEGPVQLAINPVYQQAQQLDIVQTQCIQAQDNIDSELKYVKCEQSLNEGFDAAQKLNAQYETSIQGKDAKLNQMQAENDSQVTVIDSLGRQNAALRAEIQNITTSGQQKLKALQEASEENNNQFKISKAKTRKLTQDVVNLTTIIVNLGNQNTVLETKIFELRNKPDTLELYKAIDNLCKKNTALVTENLKLRNNLTDISALAEVRANLLNEAADAEQQQAERNEWDIEQDNLLELVDDLNDENTALKADNDKLQEELQSQFRIVEQFNHAQDEALAEIERLGEERRGTIRQYQQQALNQIESSKRQFEEEIQRNTASEQELRDKITGLEAEKARLEEQIRELNERSRIAWDMIHDKDARIHWDNRHWEEERESHMDYEQELEEVNERLKERVEELEKETTEKIDKLVDEKMEVYSQWREEVKDLKKGIQEGADPNNVLKEQIGTLQAQIREMIAERMATHTKSRMSPASAWPFSRLYPPIPHDEKEDQNDDASEAETKSTDTLQASSPVYSIPDPEQYMLDGLEDDEAQPELTSGDSEHNDSEIDNAENGDANSEEPEPDDTWNGIWADSDSSENNDTDDDDTEHSHSENGDADNEASEHDDFESDQEATDDAETDDSESEDSDNINDIKSFLAHTARLYLSGLTAHNAVKMGKISGKEHARQQENLFLRLDTIKRSPSRDRALEIWTTMREGMRGIGDADRQMEFLKETIRVMEEREGWEESIEEVLARLPNARKRRRREDDEKVESWAEKIVRISRPEFKRRRV
jgi:chromosome segregation ATPase